MVSDWNSFEKAPRVVCTGADFRTVTWVTGRLGHFQARYLCGLSWGPSRSEQSSRSSSSGRDLAGERRRSSKRPLLRCRIGPVFFIPEMSTAWFIEGSDGGFSEQLEYCDDDSGSRGPNVPLCSDREAIGEVPECLEFAVGELPSPSLFFSFVPGSCTRAPFMHGRHSAQQQLV